MRREWFKIFAFATLFALCVRAFFIENYRISSESMLPNFPQGNWIFANKLAYNIRIPFSAFEIAHFKDPKPGEVVLFTLPNRGNETFIKRVIANEGDTVQITNGQVWVNNAPFKYKAENSISLETNQMGDGYSIFANDATKDFGPIIVPKKHFFALGDNRPNSIDSRVWGPIPLSCLKGNIPFRFVR